MFLLKFLIFICIISKVFATVTWLAVGLAAVELKPSTNIPISTLCKTLPGLTRKQIKFCRKNFDTMNSIRYGAREAYSECQYQFHLRRAHNV
uniref:Protein Wnt n=1 Tax=Panagrolaimus sp. PS1159 TaxID=55785 RepID=A0AC35FQH9_9BILA